MAPGAVWSGRSPRPKLHVVAVGVSDYQDDDQDLMYAAKDAKDLVAALEPPSYPQELVSGHLTVKHGKRVDSTAEGAPALSVARGRRPGTR